MNASIDFLAWKSRRPSSWASDDYTLIGTTLQLVGELLAEACDLEWGERVLDVAAGNGNATLAAARRGCEVISTDAAAELLKRSAERVTAEGLDVTFQVADAEALPFEDETFDAVLSTFGVMFSPGAQQAASEMVRICRPGGRIALANWTPNGFIGQMLEVLGRHVPLPAGAAPPTAWGTMAHLRSLFDRQVVTISATPRFFNFRYRSTAHFIETFRAGYGPVRKAFWALPEDGAVTLERDLTELLNQHKRVRAQSLVVPGEYLEIVITRR
jgi:ubiquinone/menaquinone biosynthesis C-methylase UbiE